MLAHLLKRAGFNARVLAGSAISALHVGPLQRDRPVVVCLAYVNPGALHHARRLIRRVRQSLPHNIPVILGLCNGYAPGEDMRGTLERTGS